MSFTYHERPGVYADFDASSIYPAANRSKVVAVVGTSSLPAKAYEYSDYESAYSRGDTSQLGRMLRALYENGAQRVVAYPVSADTLPLYVSAVATLLTDYEPDYLVLGTNLLDVQQTVKDDLAALAAQQRTCICLTGMKDATVQDMVARAQKLNNERIVLVGQNVYQTDDETELDGCVGAAALAGQLVALGDPAVPVHGAVLEDLVNVTSQLTDNQIDQLTQAGVTTLESRGGVVSVVRAVTTKTSENGEPSATLRELNTMLVVDEIIPALKKGLRLHFFRRKNNATTRSAILHQMVLWLEEYVREELIESYWDLNVTADVHDASICVVEFGFTVVQGMSRIYLTAHITV